MNPRKQAIQELEENGYFFLRNGANHDLYYNKSLRCAIPLKRHGVNEDTLQYIRKEIKENIRRRGQ